MDLFILLGAGLLGAVFVASQSNAAAVSPLWKTLMGGGGGAAAYFALRVLKAIPTENNINGLFVLFVSGGFAGGIAIFIFLYIRQKLK